LATKIHAVVDALANPVALSLTPGQAADITQAAPLLDEVEPDAFIGDKGYDSDALVEKLEQRGITPVIPPKANRKEPREKFLAGVVLVCESAVMRTSVKDQSAVNGIMQGEMGRGRDSRAIGVTNSANGDCVLLCSTAAIMRPLLEGEPTWRRRAHPLIMVAWK
jgi:transposase